MGCAMPPLMSIVSRCTRGSGIGTAEHLRQPAAPLHLFWIGVYVENGEGDARRERVVINGLAQNRTGDGDVTLHSIVAHGLEFRDGDEKLHRAAGVTHHQVNHRRDDQQSGRYKCRFVVQIPTPIFLRRCRQQ